MPRRPAHDTPERVRAHRVAAPDLPGFAARFRMAMAYADISGRDLARQLNVTPQAVAKWCRGQTTPSVLHLCEAVNIMNVPFDWIMRPGPPFGEEAIIQSLRAELRAADGKLTRAGVTD